MQGEDKCTRTNRLYQKYWKDSNHVEQVGKKYPDVSHYIIMELITPVTGLSIVVILARFFKFGTVNFQNWPAVPLTEGYRTSDSRPNYVPTLCLMFWIASWLLPTKTRGTRNSETPFSANPRTCWIVVRGFHGTFFDP